MFNTNNAGFILNVLAVSPLCLIQIN